MNDLFTCDRNGKGVLVLNISAMFWGFERITLILRTHFENIGI